MQDYCPTDHGGDDLQKWGKMRGIVTGDRRVGYTIYILTMYTYGMLGTINEVYLIAQLG